jgi:hypothetical protein
MGRSKFNVRSSKFSRSGWPAGRRPVHARRTRSPPQINADERGWGGYSSRFKVPCGGRELTRNTFGEHTRPRVFPTGNSSSTGAIPGRLPIASRQHVSQTRRLESRHSGRLPPLAVAGMQQDLLRVHRGVTHLLLARGKPFAIGAARRRWRISPVRFHGPPPEPSPGT